METCLLVWTTFIEPVVAQGNLLGLTKSNHHNIMKALRIIWILWITLTYKSGAEEGSSPSLTWKLQRLMDWRLCLNETMINKNLEYTYCINERNITVPCFESSYSHNSCQYLDVSATSFDKEALELAFMLADNNSNIRKIMIRHPIALYKSLIPTIDQLLTTRIWYYVARESFPWQKLTEMYIEINKYREEYVQYYQHIQSIQYPSNITTCNNATLLLFRHGCGHPGLAGVLEMYYFTHVEFLYGVVSVYVSLSNHPNEDTPFVTGSDCKHIRNKWECAFLPTTSCPLPESITQCRYHHCVQKIQETRGFATLYTPVSLGNNTTRVPISQEDETIIEQYRKYTKEPIEPMQRSLADAVHRVPPFIYRFHSMLPSSNLKFFPFISSVRYLWDAYLLRKTAFYREQIAMTIHKFGKKHRLRIPSFDPLDNSNIHSMPHMHPHTHAHNHTNSHTTSHLAEPEGPNSNGNGNVFPRCVAVHLRRGDRVLYGMNMTQYCAQHSNAIEAEDLCTNNVPFGAITLEIAITKAIELVGKKEITTMIVATDDELWLQEQRESIQDIYPDWNILSLPPPSTVHYHHHLPAEPKDGSPNHKRSPPPFNLSKTVSEVLYQQIRLGKGTQSGIHLHATMELITSCEGFLAHFGSAIAELMYGMMCIYQKGMVMGVCPPVYDFRNGL